MDTEKFWTIVDQSRIAAGGEADQQADALRVLLADRPAEEVREFHLLLVDANQRIYTWEHGNAAELVFGYLGDDGWTDFRTWVIVHGRAPYERYLADPDHLAVLLTPDFDDEEIGAAEEFGVVASQLYQQKTGTELWETDTPILEPDAKPTGVDARDDEAVLRRRYPALAANFLASR